MLSPSQSAKPRYSPRSARHLSLFGNIVLKAALVLLLHYRPPLSKSGVRSLPTSLHTKAITPIEFAAYAERISTNWLFPARSQPLPRTFHRGESARSQTHLLSCYPMSTPRNPLPTRIECVRMHEVAGSPQHHFRPWHTISSCAGAICEST
jgi:hypothetical protein